MGFTTFYPSYVLNVLSACRNAPHNAIVVLNERALDGEVELNDNDAITMEGSSHQDDDSIMRGIPNRRIAHSVRRMGRT